MMNYDLDRFLKAQELDYELALAEIRMGRKRSHWMWYIFPQIAGLGRSQTSQYYAISGLKEARAYFEHPVLGARLKEICKALLELPTNDAYAVFGSPDCMKLQSCMTLFHVVAQGDPIFDNVLKKFYGGERDRTTEMKLREEIHKMMKPISFKDALVLYETRIIPNVMFKNTKKFFEIVLLEDRPLYRPLERMLETEKLQNPYTRDDFPVTTVNLPENVWVIRFDFPEPPEGGLSYRSYVIYDPDMTKMMYFTIERPDKLPNGWDGAEKKAVIASWDIDGSRHDYGMSGLNGNEDLLICVNAYMDKFGM